MKRFDRPYDLHASKSRSLYESNVPSPLEPLETSEADVALEALETPEPPETVEAGETSDIGKTPSSATADLRRESLVAALSR